MSQSTAVRLCLAGVLWCGVLGGAAPAGGQEAPPLVGTPDEIVLEYTHPRLAIPPATPLNQTSPRTVQLLIEALEREPQAQRRVELVLSLGRTQRDEAVAGIRAALADADASVRAAAAMAAAASQKGELADDVLALVQDASPVVRAQAIRAHAALRADRTDASAAVVAGVQDTAPEVRLAAFAVAANEAEARAVSEQVPVLQGRLQLAAVEALARIGSDAGVEAVLPLLRGNVAQQSAAARALGQMKATAHAEAVAALLAHEHPTVRRAALEAMADLVEAEAARRLGVAHLGDADASVRAVAAKLAAPVTDASVVERLVELLSDPYQPVHDAALAALGQPADETVREAVIGRAVALLDAPEARRREDGTRLLGTFASNAGLEKQIAIIQTRQPGEAVDANLVRETVRALGRIGDERAAPAVRALAERGVAAVTSGNNDVLAAASATAALVAAGQLGDSGVIPTVRRAMGTNPEFVGSDLRAAAAWAMGVLGDPGDEDLARRLMRMMNAADEGQDARLEAIKAAGRLRMTRVADQLRQFAASAQTPELRWMALWAHARITGDPQPYVAPEMPWRAMTVIEDAPNP